MAIVDRASGALQLRDASSGSLLATLQFPRGAHFINSRWLGDGSIAALVSSGSGVAVHSFDAFGVSHRLVEIPDYADGRLLMSLEGGRVIVELNRPNAIAVIDVANGTIVRLERDLRPTVYGNGFEPNVPVQTGVTLCATRDGRLVAWNAATGEKRPISR
jgi:hypothetical protein